MLARPLLLTAVFLLAGCQEAQTRLDAAEDVHTFLIAVKERDQRTFDKHVDREALKADVRRQLTARAGDGDAIGAVLGSNQGDAILDRLIAPESFNLAVQQAGGGALDRTPSAAEIAAVLKPAGENRVCLPSGPGGPCAITFALDGDDWRLVSISAEGLQIRQVPGPISAAG